MASIDSTRAARDRLKASGWIVLSIDLQGHGGSSGDRYDIEDFSEYGDAVRSLARLAREAWGGSIVVVAHSLGAAAAIEGLSGSADLVDAMVLVAPLLRLRHQGWIRLASSFASPRSGALPGGVPVGWLRAFLRWNRDLPSKVLAPVPVLQVDCAADTVVDSGFARGYLHARVPDYSRVVVPGADHWEIDKADASELLWGPIHAFLAAIAARKEGDWQHG